MLVSKEGGIRRTPGTENAREWRVTGRKTTEKETDEEGE